MLRKNRQHYRETLKLGIPVILAQFGQITVGLADNMMIGHIGGTELAAASFANTLFAIMLLFAMGFAMSLTPLTGEAYGKKNYIKIAGYLKNGFSANMFIALCFLFIVAVVYWLMPYMGQPESILPLSRSYFLILGVSITPLMVFLTGKQVIDGMTNTKISMHITLMANVINIVGNYLFIYGKMGMPSLGLNGAGVGTLLSRVFMAVAIIVAFYKKRELKRVKVLIDRVSHSVKTIRKIFKIGIPLGIQFVAESAAFIVATLMMGWLGETGLAAHQIIISYSSLGYMVYQGIGVSTTIRVSNIVGTKKNNELPIASKTSSNIIVFLAVVISIFFYSFKNELPYLFTSDPEIAKLASEFILWLIAYQLFDALQISYSGVLKGLADVKIPGIIVFVCYFLIAIPFSYFAAFKWGYNEIGIWMGFPIGLSICALMFYIRQKGQIKRLIV